MTSATTSKEGWRTTILAGLANYIDAGSIVAGSVALALWQESYGLSNDFIGLLGAFGPNAIGAGVGIAWGGRPDLDQNGDGMARGEGFSHIGAGFGQPPQIGVGHEFDRLYRAAGEAAGRDAANPKFCDACFSGDYPVAPSDKIEEGFQMKAAE